MSRVIRVRYEKGVLKPLDGVDFEEGEGLVLEIKELVRSNGVERSFGIVKAKKPDLLQEEDYYDYLSERSGIP